MIAIPSTVVSQMREHAAAWYPAECCGLLFAKAGSEEAVRALCMDNLADRLHARNPQDFPRSGRDYFALNEREAARAADAAAAQGERWLAIFHSHIDCGCHFSAEDIAVAAPEGVPVDAQMWHVVLECRERQVVAARAYRWDGRGYHGTDLAAFASAPGAGR
jgi:proteasome lid subunit RPN8/RPN11